jgi:hypothetical protein
LPAHRVESGAGSRQIGCQLQRSLEPGEGVVELTITRMDYRHLVVGVGILGVLRDVRDTGYLVKFLGLLFLSFIG